MSSALPENSDLHNALFERDQAEAYIDTLRGALLFALGRGKFNPDDAVAIKAALNDGAPIRV